jgi:hypothetical protein
MTPEQKRIAIAEACGFAKDWDYKRAKPFRGWCVDGLPDYLNDLNAMRDAEETLTYDKESSFVVNLFNVCKWKINHPDDVIHVGNARGPIHATASQRADAFLITLGLMEP